MTGILHTTELAHFASMAAFAGLAVTLILGCFIIREGIKCSATHPQLVRFKGERANEKPPIGSVDDHGTFTRRRTGATSQRTSDSRDQSFTFFGDRQAPSRVGGAKSAIPSW
jgi:hypothetical protein